MLNLIQYEFKVFPFFIPLHQIKTKIIMKKYFNHLLLVASVTVLAFSSCTTEKFPDQNKIVDQEEVLSDDFYTDPAPGDGGYGDRFNNPLVYDDPTAVFDVKVGNGLPTTTSGLHLKGTLTSGGYLIGSYLSDIKNITQKLNYPVTNGINFSFPLPAGQKYNILNDSKADYDYWSKNGGFFNKVNIPWLNSAISKKLPIYLASKPTKGVLYSGAVLTGFGKEIKHLESKGLRYNPKSLKMEKGNFPKLLP
jgi:hypothetical protein